MKKVLFFVGLLSVVSFALVDATIPYVFSPNTPARSSEVNKNFDSLKVATNRLIDSLDANFTRKRDFDSATSLNKAFIDTITANKIYTKLLVADSVYSVKVNTETATITNATVISATITNGTIPTISGTTAIYDTIQSRAFSGSKIDIDSIVNFGITTVTGNIDTINTDKITASVSSIGTATATTLNTGNGANELYPMNQSMLTTSDVIFDSIAATKGVFSSTLSSSTLNTGHGDNELYAMNQNIRTTDAVTFDSLTVGANYFSDTLRLPSSKIFYSSSDSNVFAITPKGTKALSLFGYSFGQLSYNFNIAGEGDFSISNANNTGSSQLRPNASGTDVKLRSYGSSHATYPSRFRIETGVANDVDISQNGRLHSTFESAGELVIKKHSSNPASPSSGAAFFSDSTNAKVYGEMKVRTATGKDFSLGMYGDTLGTVIGFTTSFTCSLWCVKVGKMVMLTINGHSGTSNSTQYAILSLPNGFKPKRDQYVGTGRGRNGSSANVPLIVKIASNGDIVFLREQVVGSDVLQGDFTASGTKGLVDALVVWYYLE
jgi:hypothetical protein